MYHKLTKILVLVGWLLLPCQLAGQSFIVDPASIHLEETSSNWRTAILKGFVLSGNYGFSYYRVEIPPLEVGVPIQTGPDHEPMWIPASSAQKAIAWAADKAAYSCAQKFVANRSYYSFCTRVVTDFKRFMLLSLQSKVPGARVRVEGIQSPDIPISLVRYLALSYEAYLAHLGL